MYWQCSYVRLVSWLSSETVLWPLQFQVVRHFTDFLRIEPTELSTFMDGLDLNTDFGLDSTFYIEC